MENLPDFYKRLNDLIENLSLDELKGMHEEFIKNKIYGKDFSSNEVGEDIEKLKKAVNIGIQKIPIEQLKDISPPAISEAIEEYIKASEDQQKLENKPKETIDSKETRKSLLQEAISISALRAGEKGEIPRHKKERLGYVLTKLNIQFNMPARQISEATGIYRTTISDYINTFSNNNPDLVSMWMQAKQTAALESADYIPKNTDQSMENIAGSQTAGLLIEDSKEIGRAIALQRQELGKYVMETIGTVAQQFGYTSYSEFLKYLYEFFVKYHGKFETMDSQIAELKQINKALQAVLDEDILMKRAGESLERVTVAALLGGGNINVDSLAAYKQLLLRDPERIKNALKGINIPGESEQKITV